MATSSFLSSSSSSSLQPFSSPSLLPHSLSTIICSSLIPYISLLSFSISFAHLMPSRFPSFCLMVAPNSQVFPSDQDLNVLLTSRDGDDDPEHRRDKRLRPSPPPLKIRIPTSSSSYEGDKDDDEGGLKTPTSAIHRISGMLQCPPAPRKPKSLPSKKRRAPRPLLRLDLSKEIDSWFPRAVVLDVGGPIN